MGRLLILLLVVGCLHFAWKHFGSSNSPTLSGDMSSEQIGALAATVKSGDVVMYSTTECGYCTQARGWLNQNGFAFTECNMSVDERCVQEFRNFGADGTPFLLVRGYQMKNGFDSDEFLTALKM
jgi:glutaredoxin